MNSSSTMDVSLKVSPDQSQFFRWDRVSLSCGDTGHWVLKRNSSGQYNQECSDWGGKQKGSSCSMGLFPFDSGQYWCERNGSSTDAMNMTVQDGGVVLQVPVRPVSSGQTVSLICRHHSGSALPARFYRDGHFLTERPAGNMTLQQVALFDEGLYECEMSGQRSGPSRLRVRADEKLLSSSVPPSVQPSVQSPVPSAASSSLLLGVVLGSVLILLVLLVLLVFVVRRCQKQTERDDSSVYSTVCYSPINVSQSRASRTEENMLRLSDSRTDSGIRVRTKRVLPNPPTTSPNPQATAFV